MIIPIRCFTCNKVTGDSWEAFCIKTNSQSKNDNEKDTFVNTEKVKKMAAGKSLDELGFEKLCCRRIFLSHIDLIEKN